MEEEPRLSESDEQKTNAMEVEQGSQRQTGRRTMSRRRFLVISAITGGVAGTGLLIGFNILERQGKAGKKGAIASAPVSSFAPNVWVRIDADNSVTIQVAKSEMGQGILTALAMSLADELDVDWSRVRVEQALTDTQRYGDQKTDGSASISDSFVPMRFAGASARAFLVAAAAQIWGVDQSKLHTEKGAVIHPSSGKRLSYGELIGTASKIKPGPALLIASEQLKKAEQFTLIGTRVPRVDTPQKIDGSAVFGLDIRLRGMRYATIARCPILGGTLESFDSAKASTVPGVLKVIQVDSGIAIVAENTWAAVQGRAVLKINWNAGSNARLDSAQLREQLVAEVQKNRTPSQAGNGKTVEAVYETPFLAHATMEPMNCTASVQAGRCEVWVPTQNPQAVQVIAAAQSGVPFENVTVHVTFIGGGFGRRVETDFVAEAVQISKAIGAPVQVVWTREDDIQHDFYRPASYHQMSVSLTAQGFLNSWTHTVATLDTDRGDHHAQPAIDGADLPYSTSTHITGSQVSSAVPTGIWRSSNYFNTIFAVESFLDEVAAAGGLDPYQLRLHLLNNNPRLQAVLQLAASKADWGTPLPTGWGRGIAACSYFAETFVAEVVEASVASDYSVRVHRVVCAVDCGLVVHPTIAETQVEGAVVMGLSAALKGEITVGNGQIQQHNFNDYPLLRMNEMPKIEVYFVPSAENPTGLGEPGLPPIAPAVANALFAATGKRIRRLPIRPDDLR